MVGRQGGQAVAAEECWGHSGPQCSDEKVLVKLLGPKSQRAAEEEGVPALAAFVFTEA